MKNPFQKTKYVIYAGLLLLLVFWFLHATIIPDVNITDVGIVKKGVRIQSEGFDFSAQLDSGSADRR